MTSHPLTLMAVHAHPDDESIGTGGILAKYSSEGIKTVLVHCTRGEMGDIQDPEFVPPKPGMPMTSIRQLELKNAVSVLGIGSVHYLGYRDSGMAGSPENDNPDVFARADEEEASNRLAQVIRKVRPHVVVTYDENGVYGHPDHIMANKITQKAFVKAGDSGSEIGGNTTPWQPLKLYYIAIPLERLRKLNAMGNDRPPSTIIGTPEDQISTSIDVTDVVDIKFQAIFSHKSQIGPTSFFRHLSQKQKKDIFGREHFMCVYGCKSSSKKENDLFEGLR